MNGVDIEFIWCPGCAEYLLPPSFLLDAKGDRMKMCMHCISLERGEDK